MRTLYLLCGLALLAGCSGLRSYSRTIPVPLADAYACAARQLTAMGYELELQDSIGGLTQGRRKITGLVERARAGAAVGVELLTVGLAGGGRTRFDELTVFVYTRPYPQGNTIEVTAGMYTSAGDEAERSSPTDEAKADAKTVLAACAPRR